MEKAVKISFLEVKLEALEYFLGEENKTVEDVLTTHLEKTYEKCVPVPVRKFVENKIHTAEALQRSEEAVQPAEEGVQAVTEEDTQGNTGLGQAANASDRPATRRYTRRNARAGENAEAVVRPDASAETEDRQPDQGMEMVM